jgi:intracellular sulfur oxidation DsrE/DsrF family protein
MSLFLKQQESELLHRGPGRPSKKTPPPSIKRNGIVEQPNDPQHRLEFVYENPIMFKSLFTYFKNLKARDIHIRCTTKGISFFTRDQTKTSRVMAYIPGNKINHYYCDGTFWLGINRENVEKMFTSIDKSFFKITILSRHDEHDSITFVFKDFDIEKECNYKIIVSSLELDEDLLAAENDDIKNYPIEWELTAKQFKKTIGDSSNYSDTITIEKLGTLPLHLTYSCVNQLTYNEVYYSPEKIKLRAEILAGQSFRCTFKIANVKCLAAAMVTDTVRILCCENSDLLFRSEIDSLVMNTFTQLL